MKVSLKQFRSRLSYYLNQANTGKKVLITSRNLPIAIIQAIPKRYKQKLAPLVKLEHISWNGKKPKGLSDPPKIKGKPSSEIILEDRS